MAVQGLAAQVKAFTNDEVISIELEDCQEKLLVSKALLCSASDYFKGALDGAFAESSTRTLKVPGCDLETFQLFLYYLSNGHKFDGAKHAINTITKDDTIIAMTKEELCDAQIQLCRLWIFGDAQVMPRLQNATIDLFIRVLRHTQVEVGTLAYAWDRTSDNSQLRRMLMTELLNDVCDGGYVEEEMNRLGAIPGLFARFREGLLDCRLGEDCICKGKNDRVCIPSISERYGRGTATWHVKE